jgi:apolipoprotein N-acyltransferase
VPRASGTAVVATPYGRLATVVCYDRDFLDIISRVGQANADILLVPTGDWRDIDPYHTQVTTFAAIETGSSQVSQADEGPSVAVDCEGNVLASTDFFTTDPQVMVAYIPMQGVHTMYATIGDLFAWLSLVGLVALIGVALARRGSPGTPTPPRPRTVSVGTGLESATWSASSATMAGS